MPPNAKQTTSELSAAAIVFARVLDVNCENYTVSITSEYAKKPQSGISFATPYQHYENGEGIYFMPEVGSVCWVAYPSDATRPFVIAWAASQEAAGFRSKKMQLNPGDIYLGTRDENRLILRRGGIVQIGANPITQRIYMPLNNIIQDFCENYSLHTPGGDMEWVVKRDVETKDGKRPTYVNLQTRQLANDKQAIAGLKIGSHGGSDKTILSLFINDTGDEGAVSQISLKMTQEGNVTWEIKKDHTAKVEGKYTLEVTGKIQITGSDEVEIKSKKAMTLDSGDTMMIKSSGKSTIKSGSDVLIDSSSRKLGSGALYPPLLVDVATQIWLTSHTHQVTAVGAPSGPPVPSLTVVKGSNTLIE
jgi:hypothetical protein